MIVIDVAQGSKEWHDARLGIATASEFDKIITPAKGDYSKQADGYMHKLIAEIITGKEATGFMSAWMERGKAREAEARAWYEFDRGVEVRQVGFVYKDERKQFGCSPDGLPPDRGLEIKCPAPGTMVEYLLKGELPREYIPQVQGSMWVTGLPQWDILIYHDDFFAADIQPLVITIERDERYINKLEQFMDHFNKEKAEKLARLQQLRKAA